MYSFYWKFRGLASCPKLCLIWLFLGHFCLILVIYGFHWYSYVVIRLFLFCYLSVLLTQMVFSTLRIIFFPFILSLRVLCLLICLFDCLSFERSQCRNLGGNWLTTVCLSCNCNSCYQANPTILLLVERFGPKKVTT